MSNCYNGFMVNNSYLDNLDKKIYNSYTDLAFQLLPSPLGLLLVAGDALQLVGHVREVGLKLTLGLLSGSLEEMRGWLLGFYNQSQQSYSQKKST